MSQYQFNDNIKQKADAHVAPIPPDAWDNIAKKKKRRLLPFYWWSLSSLLIVAGLFFYFNGSKTKSTGLLANNQHTQLSQSESTKINTTINKKVTQNKIVDSATNIVKDKIDRYDNKRSDEKRNDSVSNLSNVNNDITVENRIKPSSSRLVFKAKMDMITTNAIASTDNTDDNNRAIKKYSTNKRLRLKTSSAEASSDPELMKEEANSTANTNVPKLDNNANDNKTILTKENTLTEGCNKLIVGILTKPPIDSSSGALKKDIALDKKKNPVQKNINAGKSPSLILDFSITPFSPIQEYDVPQYVKRISIDNGSNTVYTTNAVKTSLQFSTAFGFGIRKNIGHRFMIGTGLQYAQINENITLSGTDSNTTYMPIQRLEVNSSGPYLVNDTISSTTTGLRVITATNSYQLYSIPVFIQYNFIDHPSFSLAITGGSYFTFAQYHNSISGKLESVYAYSPQPANEKNNLAIDLFGGIRATKKLYKNFLLFAEPSFRYNPSNYKLKNTFLNKNINQAGLSLGLSYKIK
jgi:hypothetical protein